jgi:glycerol-3-phosphate dehydrogenase
VLAVLFEDLGVLPIRCLERDEKENKRRHRSEIASDPTYNSFVNRDAMLAQLEASPRGWDVLVIGGGATGLGCAIDAATRGYRTALLEAGDFARGTSSRSTKLVHGGVRYLRQGNVSLVLEALKERGLLRRNAPHLVTDLPFVVPNYDWWEAPFYGIGLRLYDMLAGKLGFGPSRNLSKKETLERLPTIETEGLRGGVIYHDGQFDDARLAVAMAQTAASRGAALMNYAPVVRLEHSKGVLRGLVVRDLESGREIALEGKVVINATGPFTDAVRRLDEADAAPMILPSQGIHVVLDRAFLPGASAIMVPHTDDGRVLFAIPWKGRVVVGTTDTPLERVSYEPRPREEEIDFLLEHAARYLTKDPTRSDVLSGFAGIRPLVGASPDGSTAAVSRDHTVHISRSGLVTVTGGKWTTYRKMAEDAVDQAALVGGLPEKPCVTATLGIHDPGPDEASEALHPRLELREAEVRRAARDEMARTVEDVLSRRSRALVLDARAAIDVAPRVAAILAAELGRDASWEKEQVIAFSAVAKGYLPEGS